MVVYMVYVEKCRGYLREFDSQGPGGWVVVKALEMRTMKGAED
jgi:hypothetical protein